MRQKRFTFLAGLALFSIFSLLLPAQDRGAGLQQEEEQDYYDKWLNEDVLYIITDEERDVFEGLSTPEEKEQFIEQFWFRRDPDPRTAENEFKEEHYRRIAYANEKFTSGDPGWRTDRGRIYILHGPPDSIESRPMGGAYVRDISEGGGITSVYPYEKWRYRNLEGIGDDIELEFVDASQSGQYKLAVFDWEKDALMMVPGGGKTLAEATGLSTRADRPALTPAASGVGYGPQNWYRRLSDSPFQRYELIAKVGGQPSERYQDLKELIEVNIQYQTLPLEVTEEYFKLNEAQVLVPITVRIDNKELTFEDENGLKVARMTVFGIISGMTNRIITEFEEDFVVRYSPEQLEEGLQRSSVFQKVVPLEWASRYKLDLIVQDMNSERAGVLRMGLAPPSFDEEQLQGSSLLLSDQIQPLDTIPDSEQMFVIGDVKILPRLDNEFTPEMPLGIYYQIYNAALDQTTYEPALKVTYNLLQDGEVLRSAVDQNGESTQFFSGRRVVLTKLLSLAGLEPGKYQVQILVEDLLKNQSVEQLGSFQVVGDTAQLSALNQ